MFSAPQALTILAGLTEPRAGGGVVSGSKGPGLEVSEEGVVNRPNAHWQGLAPEHGLDHPHRAGDKHVNGRQVVGVEKVG